MSVVSGETQSFNCTTDASRPAAWIQWYIGGQNVTDQAILQTPTPDGAKLISSSILKFTPSFADHNKTIFCEAGNIEDRTKIKSAEKTIQISCM